MQKNPGPSPEKLAEWRVLARQKQAIVPEFFEVFPNRAIIVCGKCGTRFVRTLIYGQNEPTFVCPNEKCKSRNWLPVRFK